jgi:hypothetical protein
MEDLINDQANAFWGHWPILTLQRDRLATIAAVSLQSLDRAHRLRSILLARGLSHLRLKAQLWVLPTRWICIQGRGSGLR